MRRAVPLTHACVCPVQIVIDATNPLTFVPTYGNPLAKTGQSGASR